MNAPFTVFTGADRDAWLDAWHRLPPRWRDVHLHPDWVTLHADGDTVRACCARIADDRGEIIMPFLRCRIPHAYVGAEDLWDAQGCLGYNGAAGTEDASLIADLHAGFAAWCAAERVIAAFARLNPALGNRVFAESYHEVVEINRSVVVDLTIDAETRWRTRYAHAARKQVNKARRNGLVTRRVVDRAGIESFHRIFLHTMERTGAAPQARHPLDYFLRIAERLPDHASFYLTCQGNRALAAELATHGDEVAYSFLGGTLDGAFPLAANDALKHDIIADLSERSFKRFLLGGGLAPSDGIFHYKLKFDKRGEVPFHIARCVFDRPRFDRVVAAWAALHPDRAERHASKALPWRF